MEELDQSYGFVWYRARFPTPGKATLEVGDVRDMALIYQGGKRLGALDRRKDQRSIELDVAAGQPVDLLVENMGRINYGPRLVDERKGLLGPVRFGGKPVLDWEMYRLPLDDLSRLRFVEGDRDSPAFHRGTFTLAASGDSYIDMRGWGRGHVWINGPLLADRATADTAGAGRMAATRQQRDRRARTRIQPATQRAGAD
jgi:beta-galactosidase